MFDELDDAAVLACWDDPFELWGFIKFLLYLLDFKSWSIALSSKLMLNSQKELLSEIIDNLRFSELQLRSNPFKPRQHRWNQHHHHTDLIPTDNSESESIVFTEESPQLPSLKDVQDTILFECDYP